MPIVNPGEAPSSHILKFAVPGYRNVPLYDLVCTMAIERIDTNLAFAVGGEQPALQHVERIIRRQCRAATN